MVNYDCMYIYRMVAHIQIFEQRQRKKGPYCIVRLFSDPNSLELRLQNFRILQKMGYGSGRIAKLRRPLLLFIDASWTIYR